MARQTKAEKLLNKVVKLEMALDAAEIAFRKALKTRERLREQVSLARHTWGKAYDAELQLGAASYEERASFLAGQIAKRELKKGR